MKIALITLGCPKNLVDAEVMLGMLDEAGHTLVATPDGADVAIVNTCSFIASAVTESSDVVTDCLELKLEGRLGAVIVAGCMPQRYGDELFSMLPGVDAVVGCSDVPAIVEAVTQVKRGRRVTVVHDSAVLYDHTSPRILGTPGHIAYVKISEGCDNRCAYCMIPAIRGALHSRSAESIHREVDELVAGGVREINLIAQDTTAYGTDIAGKGLLAELLRGLDATGIEWVRVLYTHPAHLTDDVIDAVASARCVVPYLDIPIQHVADHILAAMGRGTSGDDVRRLLEKVRTGVPGIAIRSSVIVGFPGESERDFAELSEFIGGGAVDHLGIFEFSPEPDTRAAGMADQIPHELACMRARTLTALARGQAVARGRALAGREIDILVDEVGEHGLAGRHRGLAWELDGVVTAAVPGAAAPGEIIPVRVVGPRGFDLEAVIV